MREAKIDITGQDVGRLVIGTARHLTHGRNNLRRSVLVAIAGSDRKRCVGE